MPTYEYKCECGHIFEDFQKMPGRQTMPCPKCGEDGKKRIGPGSGVIFKGPGFYATDYGRGQ